MTETAYSACRCPPDNHSCPHHAVSLDHDHRKNRRSADILLGFLTIFCSPAVVWIKTGKRDLTLNIILFCLVFLPGWIHAWYIVLQHPGCHRCDLTGHHTVASYHETHNHTLPVRNATSPSNTHPYSDPSYLPKQQQHQQRTNPTIELPSHHSAQEAPTKITPPSSTDHVPEAPVVSAMNTGDSRGGHWDGVQSPVSAVSSQGTKTSAMPPGSLLRAQRVTEEEKGDPELPKYVV